MEKKTNETYKYPPLLGWIFLNAWEIASWVVGIVITYISTSEYQWKQTVICGFSVNGITISLLTTMAFVFQRLQHRKEQKAQKGFQKLEEECNKKNRDLRMVCNAIPLMIKNYVIVAYEKLGLGADDRITLYLINGKNFLPCARYSKDPNKETIRRTKYSTLTGVVGKVWSNEWHFDNSFPDPINNKKAYKKYTYETYKLSFTEVNNLSMHSVCYFGQRISDTLNREKIGILLVESTSREWNEEDTKNKLKEEIEKLIPLLENKTLRSYIPNQSIIDKEEGF